MSSSTEIQPYEGEYLTGWRNPEQVLAEATQAATALKRIIDQKKKPLTFNGENYVDREDWGTLGRFYSCTAKSISTQPCEYNGAKGWEAVAVVIDTRTGMELGRAEAMCLDDEENWGSVPKYEWKEVLDENGKKQWDPNLFGGKGGYVKEKVPVGLQHKPQFQLRSMAQTRAEVKAMKGVLGWVAVLAGYRATPAEEVITESGGTPFKNSGKAPIQEPQRSSQKSANQPQTFEGVIEQVKKAQSGPLWLMVKTVGLVRVEESKIDGDMKVGATIKFHGVKGNDPRVGDFLNLTAMLELSIDDGEPLFAADEDPGAAQDIEDLKNSGMLRPASEVPSPKGRKTIGPGREQRLYAIMTQSKDKNGGMTKDDVHHILSLLPIPLEHLRDLEAGMEAQFEKWVSGAEDWKAWLNDLG